MADFDDFTSAAEDNHVIGLVHAPLDDSPEDLRGLHKSAVERYDRLGWPRPKVALVAGSGLSVDLGERLHGPVELEYFVPFAVHPVAGHPHLVDMFEPQPGCPVLYFRGRLHSYQGYSTHETVFPVRLARLLGASVLVMTNATGGLEPRFAPGTLVLVRDQINLLGANPLCGQLPDEWGPRFPDMVGAYDPRLAELAQAQAAALGLTLDEGVYVGTSGPSYETPAEVRMMRQLGGDVVGMSTVLEIIAAHHMGMKNLCLSMVSNPAAGLAAAPVDHADVLAAATHAAEGLGRLLAAILADPALLPAG
jgi:purine-nucleoside phosphorylase